MTQFHFRTGTALSETDNARVHVGKAGKSGYVTRQENCSRCGGQGGSNAWAYTGWTCYRCMGKCTEAVTRRVFTADRLNVLNINAQKKQDKRVAAAAVAAGHKRTAFIAWAKPHGKVIGAILTGKGNFFDDLASKLRSHLTLSYKQMAAAVRIVEQSAQRATQDGSSVHVGEIKERIEFEAQVEFTKEFDGYYGTSTMIKFRDLRGNVLTWFKSDFSNLQRGDRVAVKGTVKKHDEYQGTKQTILTRCKVTKFEILEADEAATQECIA